MVKVKWQTRLQELCRRYVDASLIRIGSRSIASPYATTNRLTLSSRRTHNPSRATSDSASAVLSVTRCLLTALLVLTLCAPLAADKHMTAAARSAAARREFKKLTGYPQGRPGYVIDHIIPLCAGGRDAVSNMQWEPVFESYTKDKYERALCAEMKRQGYVLHPRPTARP